MPHFSHLPIMPKEPKPSTSHGAAASAPYPPPQNRNAAIWSSADDAILLRARASGLNWQPIASKHFPHKSANACRKRHERLIERRHAEDWDAAKLERLAHEYVACRREMWEVLARRVGERWNVVEAKCMEKGLKTLQSTARTAQRKTSVDRDHHSDSGIVLSSGSEAEMDGDDAQQRLSHGAWSVEHLRSRSLPVPPQLPLYRPPVNAAPAQKSPETMSFEGPNFVEKRYSPGVQGRGISIQSVLAPAGEEGGGSRGELGCRR